MLVLAIACAVFSTTSDAKDSDTERKLRLMAEALRARDVGDYASARANLHELSVLTPADPAVKRLLVEIGAKTDIFPDPQPSAKPVQLEP